MAGTYLSDAERTVIQQLPAKEACAACEGAGLVDVVDSDGISRVRDDCPECGGHS